MTKVRLPDNIRLVLISFQLLFVELVLIRWLGSNILFVSFFSNFVLLGSFLGIGIGFLRPTNSTFYLFTPLLLAILVIFVAVFPVHITYHESGIDTIQVIGNYKKSGLPIWITLPIIFTAVTAIMASIANFMAILFRKFSPLHAYRLDILGALGGIITFSILSYFNTPPVIWGGIICCIFMILFFDEWKKESILFLQMGCLSIFFFTLAIESVATEHFWSPYYKITLQQYVDKIFKNYFDVWVNGIPHQRIESVERRRATEPYYFYPYKYKKSPENVLIIGAGTGSDVAIALAEGAKHIDAVEIDPLLYQLGRNLNPDQPYSNPNVQVIINDGRAFLQQNHPLYDMILFAMTDSLTLVSGQSSLRLESYLYTTEAILAAKKHLKPDGILALSGYYNYRTQSWLIERYANTLQQVFKQTPCIDTYGNAKIWNAILTISSDTHGLTCEKRWTSIAEKYIAPATDDHPFLYLKFNTIPTLYLITLFIVFGISLLMMRLNFVTIKTVRSHLDLFFMGMAFLMLETKSIVIFSLLFGSTWIVNALVFSGILTLVYLSIEVTHYFPKLSVNKLYVFLLLSLFFNWIIPTQSLLSLPEFTRFIAASILIFSPVFLANLIFANRFQHTNQSTIAFGVNMIGAMIGGLLEYVALITGYKLLIIFIAIFYTLAFLLPQKQQPQPMW